MFFRRKLPWILPIVPDHAPWDERDSEALRLFLNSDTGSKLMNSLYVNIYELNLDPRPTDDIHRGRIQGMTIAANVILQGCHELPKLYEDAIEDAEKEEDFLGSNVDQLNLNS